MADALQGNPVTSAPGQPPPDPTPTTPRQYALHVAGILIAALATQLYNKYTQPPTPTTGNPPAAVAPAQATPPSVAPTGGTVRVDTLRIEAAKIELVGNVNVTIPEIKIPAGPDVIVENKLPPEVTAALLKQPAAPVVNVKVDGNTLRPTAAVLPDPIDDPVPPKAPDAPPARPAPVRITPTIDGKK